MAPRGATRTPIAQIGGRAMTTVDELLTQKIADALRDGKSERHLAKLLGLSRMQLWRARMMAQIPEPLLERLHEARRTGQIRQLSSKLLAAIGRALQDGELF